MVRALRVTVSVLITLRARDDGGPASLALV